MAERMSTQSLLTGESRPTIWTIGHSTRSFDAFLALLLEYRIQLLADVRHYPVSQRVPWTTKTNLARGLQERGIAYEHFEDLGGYRKAATTGLNQGWRNAGFRGYADHMASPEFRAALDHLLRLTGDARVALMCAEALPWKCHRSLLSDALLIRGARVVHILGPGQSEEHRLTSFAKVDGDRVTYPAAGKRLKPRDLASGRGNDPRRADRLG